MQDQWIEVFRSGTHTDSKGRQKTWTEAELDQVVAATRAHLGVSGLEAPAVIGHPETEAPAYGWVADIARRGQVLLVKFRDLVPQFVDAVKRGMFPNRSVAIRADSSLDHIGFLGAKPPAIKGLAPIAFAQDDATAVITFETPDKEGQMPDDKKTFMEKVRALFGMAEELGATVELPGLTKPGDQPQTFSQADVDAALERGRTEGKTTAADAQAAERRQAAVAANKAAVATFCEQMKDKGHVLPAWEKAGLRTFLEQLAERGEEVYAFAAAADAPKLTPLAWMQSFLEGLPAVVNFAEVARADKDGAGATAAETIRRRCYAAMEKDRTLTYGDAFAKVTKEDRALAERYLSEARG